MTTRRPNERQVADSVMTDAEAFMIVIKALFVLAIVIVMLTS